MLDRLPRSANTIEAREKETTKEDSASITMSFESTAGSNDDNDEGEAVEDDCEAASRRRFARGFAITIGRRFSMPLVFLAIETVLATLRALLNGLFDKEKASVCIVGANDSSKSDMMVVVEIKMTKMCSGMQ